LSHSFILFCLYGAINGLGWALLSGAEEAYIYEESRDEKKVYRKTLSDVTIVDEIATILGLIGSAIITKLFGLQQSIIVAAITLGIAAIVSIKVLYEPTKHLSVLAVKEKKLILQASEFIKKHSDRAAQSIRFSFVLNSWCQYNKNPAA
jgi:uncharacterized membrane protein YuzA (DUF378 family)